MIGERIRQARLVARMTQDEVVEKLAKFGKPMSKQSLSNYEKNKRTPAPSILLVLAKAFSVKPGYFFSAPIAEINWLAYRSHTSLRKRDKSKIEAHAQDVAEKFVYLFDMILPGLVPDFPEKTPVSRGEEAEGIAQELRDRWSLGIDPINNLTLTIEKKGSIVSHFKSDDIKFDGLSGWVSGRIPIIVINSNIPTDRQRFNLAHEIGHLVMDCSSVEEREEEKLAHRFAGAFLAPAEAIRQDFITDRRRISWQEIGIMKQRYGLSMQASIFRLRDMGIISDSAFNKYYKHFNWKGWRTFEPYSYEGIEVPTRFRQMTLYAVSEGIITPNKAEELLPGCTEEVEAESAEEQISHLSPSELMKMPIAERREILRAAAATANKEYEEDSELTDFEAFGEDDLYG